MASTDTRSGFRLPWSSDRSHEDSAPDAADGATAEDAAPVDPEAVVPEAVDPAWPQTDINAALGLTRTEQRPVEASPSPTADPEEPPAMIDIEPAAPASPPRKSSKLMVDLSAAIRATAEASQAQTLDQVASDSQQVVDAIRASSTDGAAGLKARSDEDLAAIREWSKAEIARIREETDARITARKATLEDELAGHAAAVDRRVDEVNAEVARFEAAMVAYRERLEHEDDPAKLATMAEEVPETPSFEAWADLGTLDITFTPDPFEPEAVEAVDAVEAVVEPVETEAILDPVEPEAVAQTPEAEPEPTAEAVAPVEDWYAPAEEPAEAVEAVANPWGDETNGWTEPDAAGEHDGTAESDPDVPRWAVGETPDGFPTGDEAEAGDPVDRGAIMAALEAAAEAVVAAESAAESADQAEAAADVAETAAELLVGRTADGEDYDPEAAAAMSARVDAGGFDTESYADRLASLLPGHGDGAVGDEERTTQVVVGGLVSVASIASFKSHLGRLPGVQAVAVASGPEGEFVFNVTHRADLSFRDAIPSMPGFAARVTGSGDGVVNVTARDPEAEG
jgi:hypothetical protein